MTSHSSLKFVYNIFNIAQLTIHGQNIIFHLVVHSQWRKSSLWLLGWLVMGIEGSLAIDTKFIHINLICKAGDIIKRTLALIRAKSTKDVKVFGIRNIFGKPLTTTGDATKASWAELYFHNEIQHKKVGCDNHNEHFTF